MRVLPATEIELINKLVQRDEKAFAQLYRSYNVSITEVVRYHLFDDETVKDLVQEIFTRIWFNIAKFDCSYGVSLYTWMVQVANNICIDKHRSMNYKKNKVKAPFIEAFSIDEQINTKMDFNNMVETLDFKYKIIVQLTSMGYTQEEIAAMQEMPLGTVKTRLRSSITRMRHSLTV
jgi:RNA polymerase sigma factor (sigma-70 family)